MPRTGQPSTRDVEATVRAVEILDALAEGGELGTTDVARRTGISPSTVSRQLGTLSRVGLVEHVAATGRYRLGVRIAALRERRPRPAQPARRRPPAPRGARRTRSARPRRSSIPGDDDAITVDFVPSDRYLQGVTQPRAAERRSRVVGRQGDARVRRRPAAARQARAPSRRRRSPTRARSRAEIERVRARGLRRGDRGARGRALRRSPRRSGAPTASSPRSWRCRARRAASTAPRSTLPVPLLLTCAGAISRRARLAVANVSRRWQLHPAVDDSGLTRHPLRA